MLRPSLPRPVDLAPARLGPDHPISRLIASAVDRLLRRLPMLDPLRRLFETVARYASVGVASSLLYALAVAVETAVLGIAPGLSAVLAYAVTIPFNFLLHRHFTFRSARGPGGDFSRYALAQGVSMAVSWAAMALAVDMVGLGYGFGILGGIVLVPVVTYLLLDRWVFAKRRTGCALVGSPHD